MLQLGKLKEYRKKSRREARQTEPGVGVTNRDWESNYVDPFFTTKDAEGRDTVLNRSGWTEGNNRSPYAGGTIRVTRPDGSYTDEPWYWADAAKKAALGTTGFDQVSEQLAGLQESFGNTMRETLNQAYANSGTLNTGGKDDRGATRTVYTRGANGGLEPMTVGGDAKERRARMNSQFA